MQKKDYKVSDDTVTYAIGCPEKDWAVFVEEKGRARRRLVDVGQRSGLTAEIISGLNENEKVVAYPDDAITDGTKIKARK